MLYHFGTEIAHALKTVFGFIFQMRTPGDIQRAARQALVHRQHEPETACAAFVPQRLIQRFPQRQGGIFHRVMIVDMQIALHGNIHAQPAMGRYLIEHVIEKADAGVDTAAAFSVEPDLDVDGGFPRHAVDARMAIAAGELLADSLPVERLALITQPANTHIGRERHIGFPVTDDITVGVIQRALL